MVREGKVGIGFIGCGSHAVQVHYPSLVEFEDVEIVGICDLDEGRLNGVGDRFGIGRRFTNYKEMLEKTDPEAVYVVMPPHQLFDIVIDCLRRGLHVFIEKPPGVSLEQARNMARLAERMRCLTMVGFNRRFIPILNAARGMVLERGPMQQCVATFYKFHVYGEPYYGGAVDVLTCDAIHAVDALRWMASGEARRVASVVRAVYSDFPNSFLAVIEFDNGCVGVLLTNWAAGKRIHTFEMHGKGISAFVNPDPDGFAILYSDGSAEGRRIEHRELVESGEHHKIYGFYQENRHFVDCIKSGRMPQTNFGDAVKTMELVEAIYRSQL
jgi:virulence factor